MSQLGAMEDLKIRLFEGNVLSPSYYLISIHDSVIILSSAILIFVAILILALYFCSFPKQQEITQSIRKTRIVPEFSSAGGEEVKIAIDIEIPLAEVKQATGKFNGNFVIGTGENGTVFKGRGIDGESWAVKRYSNGVATQCSDNFMSQIGILFRMSHPNLVKLIGFCDEKNEKILVFEFVPNGNLKQHLRPKNPHRVVLPFQQRLKIAASSASALNYLHTHNETPYCHKNVKSESILLDKNYDCKIGGFGLHKLLQPDSMPASVPYTDPEFYSSRKYTPKSDVYSFGVVLLELMSGQQPIIAVPSFSESEFESNFKFIGVWAKELIQAKNINTLADPKLKGDYSERQLLEVVTIALECLKSSSNERPAMETVLERLKKVVSQS